MIITDTKNSPGEAQGVLDLLYASGCFVVIYPAREAALGGSGSGIATVNVNNGSGIAFKTRFFFDGKYTHFFDRF